MSLKKSLSSLSSIFSGKPKPLTEEQKEKARKYLNRVNEEVNDELEKATVDVIGKRLNEMDTKVKIYTLKKRAEKLGGKSRRRHRRNHTKKRRHV